MEILNFVYQHIAIHTSTTKAKLVKISLVVNKSFRYFAKYEQRFSLPTIK
jgi:hypothetical protein